MNRTRWAAAGGALAFVVFSLVVLNGVLARTTDTSTTTTERAIFEVQRGPLTISINVSGTI
ncbi:MAG TPA: hypothetical protein PK166_04405, partial [Candidatus Hydrogenedentes bacterium]|nr:hypothetical protein [Candidatus Hydrogenedentota bacterium]